MATYTHGVTFQDVLGECLFDTVNITASTTPVSTTLITTYIEQEADRINAILEEKGIDPASIASYESSQGLVANLLIEGAALKTNQKHGIPRLALQDLRERYDKHLAGLGSLRGANLGAAEPRKPGQRVDADPDNPRGLLISRKG